MIISNTLEAINDIIILDEIINEMKKWRSLFYTILFREVLWNIVI